MKKRMSAIICVGLLTVASDAMAVVGRPLTPVSYAGVARRTTRRAVVARSATTYQTTAYQTTAVTALPAGCAHVVAHTASYYNCGSVRYSPVYSDGTLVYVRAAP
jgi:hypothetical protein